MLCNQCLYVLLYTVKNGAIHEMPIVALPEPKLLFSNGTPAYWVLPESSKHYKMVASSYWGPSVGINEIEIIDGHVTKAANYLRFFSLLVSGAYYPVALKPHSNLTH